MSDQLQAIGRFTPTETILCQFKPNNTLKLLVFEGTCYGDAWFESRQENWPEDFKRVRVIAKSDY
jgi:hypothetical protein